ncbi:hypothetical protein IJJ08_04455 [bacterium]|nr:hypothetical protein [bacterium]
MSKREEKGSQSPPIADHTVRNLVIKLVACGCIFISSTFAIASLFVPQWSKLIFDVSLISQTSPAATSNTQAAKTEIVISEGLVSPSEEIATISANFLADLVHAILEATSEAEVASAEAQLEESVAAAIAS